MDWDKLKTFYHVARIESFTATGKKLNLSQSAISRAIIALEDRLGHKLFNRLSRGLVLTKQGEILYKNVEKMFAYSELAISQINQEESEPLGNLTVGTNVGLLDTWLSYIIPEFLKKYPKINLSLTSSDDPLDVEAFNVDVALRPYAHNQPDLTQILLMSWHRKLYASQEYLDKFGVPKCLEDLDHHRLISYGPEEIHLFKEINTHLKQGRDPNNPRKPYTSASSVRTVFELANNGIGIAEHSQESPLLKGSNLIQVLPEVSGAQIDIYYVYPTQLENIKRIQVLKDFLMEEVEMNYKPVLTKIATA